MVGARANTDLKVCCVLLCFSESKRLTVIRYFFNVYQIRNKMDKQKDPRLV